MRKQEKKLALIVRRSYSGIRDKDSTHKIWQVWSPLLFYWFKHRKDGPAVITGDGIEEWYDRGVPNEKNNHLSGYL